MPRLLYDAGQPRLEPRRFLAVWQALFGLRPIDKNLTQVAPRQGQLGIEVHGGAKRFEGVVLLAQLVQGGAEVVLGHGELGPHPQGLAKRLDGLRMAAEGVQRQAEVVRGFGVIGPQPQGRAAAVDGLFVLADGAVSLGQIGVVGGGLGPQGHGPADQLDGPGGVAALVVHHAEEVQRLGVVRLPGQKGIIAAGSVRIAARLVELPTDRQVRIHHANPLQGTLLSEGAGPWYVLQVVSSSADRPLAVGVRRELFRRRGEGHLAVCFVHGCVGRAKIVAASGERRGA